MTGQAVRVTCPKYQKNDPRSLCKLELLNAEYLLWLSFLPLFIKIDLQNPF